MARLKSRAFCVLRATREDLSQVDFCVDIYYYIVVDIKGGEIMVDEKKLGRPSTPNPKRIKLTVRITPLDYETLLKYCKKKNISIADGVRCGIQRLEEK